MKQNLVILAVVSALAAFSQSARADGLSDLKGAMQRLQAKMPVKAALETKFWRRLGDPGEEINGQVSANLEEGSQGLQVLYTKDVVNRIEAEEKAKARDPNSKTPTLSTTREMDVPELRSMLNAGSLQRVLDKAIFKSERNETHQGKAARVLSFDIPLDILSERERKYAKKLDGNLEVWIAHDGTPLASRTQVTVKGSAFLVINFESKSDEHCQYSLQGDRLVTVRKEISRSMRGAGEKEEAKIVKTLHLQS